MANRELVLRLELRFPRWSRRRWAAIALAAALLGGAVASANVMWTAFNPGEKLSSAKLNTNFKALADAINALQSQPPGATPLPHVVTNSGNTDLGVYLGPAFFYAQPGHCPGATIGSDTCIAPMVYSTTLKGPYIVGWTGFFVYDGKNCTGTGYAQVGGVGPFLTANLAANSGAGTIFQLTGTPVTTSVNLVAGLDEKGLCNNFGNPMSQTALIPIQDTKVPNIPVTNPTMQTRIVSM